MEIIIADIPEAGLKIEAGRTDVWFERLMSDSLGPAFEKDDRASLDVKIDKVNENVNLGGVVEWTFHPDCDRCLKHIEKAVKLPFHAVLSPLYESERQRRAEKDEFEEELVKEDLDFEFYEGDRFDLADIVREQVLLAMPMKNLCREDCNGLCQKCGKDLNAGPCKCKQEIHDPRWEALKGFKVKAKKGSMGKNNKKTRS